MYAFENILTGMYLHFFLKFQLTFRLKIPRFDFGCAILNDWLFVMGGQISPGNTTNLTEKIDLTTGESIMLAPMVCERALFSAAYLPSIDFDTA